MLKETLILFTAILIFSGCPGISNPDNDLELGVILDEAVSNGLIGVSCYIMSPNGIQYEASGLTGLEGDSITTDNLFWIASQSKMFYGAAISILIAEGQLDENNLISEYLPAHVIISLTNGRSITLDQLIHHTSGLHDYLNDDEEFTLAVLNNYSKKWTIEEAVVFAYGKPATNNPGEKYDYSNTNYLLLALIIQELTGADSGEFLRNRILEPLELHHTFINSYDDVNRENIAHGYYYEEEIGYLSLRDNHGDLPGDGGILSTPEDTVKFLDSIMINDEFPSPENRDAFLEAFLPAEASTTGLMTPSSYGAGLMGIQLGGSDGEICLTHGGSIPGYNTEFAYYPDLGIGFCVMYTSVEGLDNNEIEQASAEMMTSIFSLLGNL